MAIWTWWLRSVARSAMKKNGRSLQMSLVGCWVKYFRCAMLGHVLLNSFLQNFQIGTLKVWSRWIQISNSPFTASWSVSLYLVHHTRSYHLPYSFSPSLTFRLEHLHLSHQRYLSLVLNLGYPKTHLLSSRLLRSALLAPLQTQFLPSPFSFSTTALSSSHVWASGAILAKT